MKFSENTLMLLKNFASINSGIVLREGNSQKTISPERAVLVQTEIEDTIPCQFGIYDLNQFLGNLTALDNPQLEFNEKMIIMSDGEIDLKYHGSSVNTIVSPPDKELIMKQIDVSFNLTNSILQKFLRLASMNNLTHLSIVGNNGKIQLQAHDKSNDTSNMVSFKLNDYDDKDFITSFKVENIKLIPADYDVEIQFDAFAKFTVNSGNLKDKIKYYIAVETK